MKGHGQLLRINLGANMVGTSMQADANRSMGAGSNAPAEYDRSGSDVHAGHYHAC
jgi:hypothetical protein